MYEEGDTWSKKIDDNIDEKDKIRDQIKEARKKYDEDLKAYWEYKRLQEIYEYHIKVKDAIAKRSKVEIERSNNIIKALKKRYLNRLDRASNISTSNKRSIEDLDKIIRFFEARLPQNQKAATTTTAGAEPEAEEEETTNFDFTGLIAGAGAGGQINEIKLEGELAKLKVKTKNSEYQGQMNVIEKKSKKKAAKPEKKKGNAFIVAQDDDEIATQQETAQDDAQVEVDESVPAEERPVALTGEIKRAIEFAGTWTNKIEKVKDIEGFVAEAKEKKDALISKIEAENGPIRQKYTEKLNALLGEGKWTPLVEGQFEQETKDQKKDDAPVEDLLLSCQIKDLKELVKLHDEEFEDGDNKNRDGRRTARGGRKGPGTGPAKKTEEAGFEKPSED